MRVIRAELLAGDGEDALLHWTDLRERLPDLVPEVDLAARLACALGEVGHAPEAAALVHAATARIDVATPASALVALVRAARFADAPVASAISAHALAHPGLPIAVRRELEGGAEAPSLLGPALP